jgi:predicted nucleic acid-binding protein
VIFVDTTEWVADADRNDEFHGSAHEAIDSVRLGTSPVGLTTDFIIDETVTLLGKRKGFGASAAAEVGRLITASPRVVTVFVDEGILKESITAFPKYAGKLSLTDVVSTIVMKRYSVKEIFSHDSDFDLVSGIRRITKA